MYWAQELAEQTEDTKLSEHFSNVYKVMAANETKIITELNDAQGDAEDIGGYYKPDQDKTANAMRPSSTLNGIINSI